VSKEQKDFTRAIEKLNSTLDKVDLLSRQAKLDLAEICNNAKQVYIVGPEAIVPLFADDELTPPEPGAELVHTTPKRTRTRKKIDLNAGPPAESEEEKTDEPGPGQEEEKPEPEEPNQ